MGIRPAPCRRGRRSSGGIVPRFADVQRFNKRFSAWVFSDISACLNSGASVGAVILCCCAIDYLSRYYSGQPAFTLNKSKYIDFMTRYFGGRYNPDEFYKLVRCGLLHGYNMQHQYLVVGSKASWAQSLHMMYDSKHRATVVNPFALYTDVKHAFEEYLADLEIGGVVFNQFRRVWASSTFERPQISSDWNKFKAMVPDALRFKCYKCGDYFANPTDSHFQRCRGSG